MSDANVHLVNPPGAGPIWRIDQGAGAGASRDLLNFQADGAEVFSVDCNGLPDPGGGDAKGSVNIPLGDIAADSDALEMFLIKFTAAVTLTAIKICVDTATADGSINKQTITIKRSADGATVIAFTTAAANPGLAQATWTSLGDVPGGGNNAVTAATYLYCTFTKVSSGLALSGATLRIEYTYAG